VGFPELFCVKAELYLSENDTTNSKTQNPVLHMSVYYKIYCTAPYLLKILDFSPPALHPSVLSIEGLSFYYT
jgi:hypothetical protein